MAQTIQFWDIDVKHKESIFKTFIHIQFLMVHQLDQYLKMDFVFSMRCNRIVQRE